MLVLILVFRKNKILYCTRTIGISMGQNLRNEITKAIGDLSLLRDF